MSGGNILLVALGAVFLAGGSAVIAERRRIADWNNAVASRRTNGRDGEVPGRRMTAGMTSVLGAMVGIIGAVLLILGLTVNARSNGGGAGGLMLSRLLGIVFVLPFMGVLLYLRSRDRRSTHRTSPGGDGA
jgi:hypothetical protein